MVASASFAEFLREQLVPLGHVSLRRMFGKLARWRAPDRLFDDSDALLAWARLALAAANRIAARRKLSPLSKGNSRPSTQ